MRRLSKFTFQEIKSIGLLCEKRLPIGSLFIVPSLLGRAPYLIVGARHVAQLMTAAQRCTASNWWCGNGVCWTGSYLEPTACGAAIYATTPPRSEQEITRHGPSPSTPLRISSGPWSCLGPVPMIRLLPMKSWLCVGTRSLARWRSKKAYRLPQRLTLFNLMWPEL